jgi:4-oxalocrotonate tautomerase
MPMIQITMLTGRTTEQKRNIAQRLTDVLVEETGTAREGVAVAFYEVSKESYAGGGVLISDK